MSIATNDRAQSHAFLFDVAPGVVLSGMLAVLAFGLHDIPGLGVFSPMIMAIVLGIGFQNLVGTPHRARAGVKFSLRRILRLAIILLGLQLTAQQVVEVGGAGVAVIVGTLVATFIATKWVGKLLGVDRKLAELIAAGTSICGASAVIATNTVTRAHDEDVAYAVACVTVFGSLSMFLYPALPGLLRLTPHAYGLWTGASIHEIAQVVAAAFQDGNSAGQFATVAKLTRVSLLAPVVITLGLIAARRSAHAHSKASAPMPYFVLGFVALVILNSLIVIPAHAKADIVLATTFLLSLSLAAMGLETDVRKLAAKGLRPFALGAFSWIFISAFSLALIKLFG
jgi:uncharacterized integral membrane protein (TIGR00698 family)